MKFKLNYSIVLCIILSVLCYCDYSAAAPQPSAQRSSDYTVTHLDIRDAILSLVSVLRDQMDKLERHEVRERQLGEQVTRALNILEKRSRAEEKNMENMAQYISRLDEKVKFVQTTLEKNSDERKLDTDAIKADLASLRQSGANSGGSSGSRQLEGKVDALSEKVTQVQEATSKNAAKLDALQGQIEDSSAAIAAAAASAAAAATTYTANASPSNASGSSHASPELSETLMNELSEIKEALTKATEAQLLQSKQNSQGGNEWQTELTESMDSQRKQLAQLEEEIGKAVHLLGDMTTSASSLQKVLNQLENDTKSGFEALDNQVDILRTNTTEDMDVKLNKVQDILKSGQKLIEGKVKDAETAIETLFTKMENGYDQLSRELKGLSNVESVLLDTGDSVLDTKRRLEYGVQQIMGEVSYQLQTHTSKLNESLQQRFDGLATAVLGNQSIALTNLTSRMEEEISQVWRQIGILYHQMSRSANLLDEIHSQTSKYVNNSLDTMTSMDGKVGAITFRMGEVDDNLNYLLGRMSLVVQEFNMIKGGLGDALRSLKDSFSEIQVDGNKAAVGSTEGPEANEIVPLHDSQRYTTSPSQVDGNNKDYDTADNKN